MRDGKILAWGVSHLDDADSDKLKGIADHSGPVCDQAWRNSPAGRLGFSAAE
jgi:hypothetical protein